MNKRIYSFKGQKRGHGNDNYPDAIHSVYPIPCIIGQECGKKIKWIVMEESIYCTKDRNKATICKSQESTQALVNYCGFFTGFTKIFVETL